MQNEDILKFLLDNENGLFNKMKVVCANTQRTLRMVMNAIYSYLFNVEISDQPILAKNSKKGLTYGELRNLSFLRNSLRYAPHTALAENLEFYHFYAIHYLI